MAGKEETKRVVMQRRAWIDGELVEPNTVVEVPRLLAFELLESNKGVLSTPEIEAAAKKARAAASAERERAAKEAPENRG